jgi:hypothetical protein
VISGLPGTASSTVVKVTVTDALALSTTLDVNLPVAAKLAIVNKLKPAKVGKTYTAHVAILGGFNPFTYRIVSGKLPAGIHFNKTTGMFTGKPSVAGTSHFTVQVMDKLHQAVRAKLVLKVNA